MTRIASPQIDKQISAATAPRQTKAALLRAGLVASGGVSLTELMQLTGWQAHTLRAALSGLRKAGLTITCKRDGRETIYAVDTAGVALAPDKGPAANAAAADADPGIKAGALAVPLLTASGTPDAPISEPGQAMT